MAPIKRKNESRVQSDHANKKQKSSSTARPSILSEEQPAFPRGGASVLTPLEHKQIQIQARQDVLFEQKTGQKIANQDIDDEEFDENTFEQADAHPVNSKRRSNAKFKKKIRGNTAHESSVRIEGLSYKRVVPGSIILGQVSQINRYDISLCLPNNLTGFVPLTSISEQVTKNLEDLVRDENDADEEEENDKIDPKAMVFIGQYLRAFVVSTEQEASNGTKGKRHIELSINPHHANSGLKESDLVTNCMVQASVVSVEDHGLIMDIGLGEAGVRGFMSSKELGPDTDVSKVKEGALHLCLVTGKSSDGRIVKLSADPAKIGAVKKSSFLTDAPTVDSFLPGTAIDLLISQVTTWGIVGKVMGLLDVTADFIHSGAASSGKDLEKYVPGTKIRGRIICTFPRAEEKKLGVSLQDHILLWKVKTTTSSNVIENTLPTQQLHLSAIVEQATVVKIERSTGLLLDLGIKGVRGFVHISKVSDGKIETLSESVGPYRLGTQHKARVIGYNAMDGLFIVSMEKKIIDQAFLRIEDVKVGQTVKGKIEKMMINASGFSGVLVNVAEGITGLVPETHLADIHLQHPEKKFKEGSAVTARVLSTDLERRQMRLTLKKTLVNSDVRPWTSYEGLKPGMEAPGTIVNILQAGAVVQFYGQVRAFLPVSEMSEAYIQDPKQHFNNGQVVNVHIVSVDASEKRMTVSCKDPLVFGAAQQTALRTLEPGLSITGIVTEKTKDELILDLEPSGLKATLSNSHLADGSIYKIQSVANRIRVGQVLKDLIILSKEESKRLIRLTSKPSLVKAAKERKLPIVFENIIEGSEIQGYVRNITATGVYVQFGGELTALLLKQHLPEEIILLPDYGMQKNQSVTTRVLSVDYGQKRFLVTMKPPSIERDGRKIMETDVTYDKQISNPVDDVSNNIDDYTLGKLTKARIVSIKETQMNVQLADSVQGRIDISEVFDNWEEINDRKHPLKKFRTKQVLPVRVLGMHDSRNHRFLPITHRNKAPVFELTAKPSNQTEKDLDILSINKVEVGSTWLTFVNNVSDDHVWVSLSPNVRGRIRAMDISDNVSQLRDLAKNFPIGSVLKAKVIKIDVENNHLDLSARSGSSSGPATVNELVKGSILPGRITKVTERQVMVQLSESLSAPVHLVDLADDYSKANPSTYRKNQIIRVCIKNVDVTNERITLSTRPSRILSSSLPVRDPEVDTISQLKVNDIVRGFIKNVTDNGVFVSLSSNVTAIIRVTDLSDAFLKEWKSDFEVDQLVEGKIISVDPMLNHLQMSLRKSHVDNDYEPPLTLPDMRYGQVISGKVRKVEDFGVFIVVDNSANVSGLCHRTKMSDQAGANPKKLYEEGDVVQAKVLSINKEKKQISFGLKASYFKPKAKEQKEKNQGLDRSDDIDLSDSDASIDGTSGVELAQPVDVDEDDASKDDVGLRDVEDLDSNLEMDENKHGDSETHEHTPPSLTTQGLSTGGFDWTGGMSTLDDIAGQSETDTESIQPKKKKRRKAEIKIDKTGDLDAHGPQSTADFERLLMGRPNSSLLWLQYMAFQLELGEINKAREIAERALKTIHIREEGEKLNVWIAMLNLENTYGDQESLDAIFKRACQYNDSLEIHSRLASIYIQSHAFAKADELFQATLKKHSQHPDLYTNFATFLMSQLASPDRARALLPRAMQALPNHTHLALTSKFAQLEFTTPHGSPERGRTVFETLLSQWPKRLDLWNVLLDLEMKQGDKEIIRRLFERVTGGGPNLKPRKAKFFFKKWLDWEMKSGDAKSQERVKALAAEYVRKQGKQVDIE